MAGTSPFDAESDFCTSKVLLLVIFYFDSFYRYCLEYVIVASGYIDIIDMATEKHNRYSYIYLLLPRLIVQ